FHNLLQRAQQEAPFRPARLLNDLVQVAQNGISLLLLTGLLLSFHWGIAFVLLAATVPGVLVRLRYARVMYRWHRERTPTQRRAWYFHWVLVDGGHAKEIRLFDLGRLFKGWFRDRREALRVERLRVATRRSTAAFVAQAGAAAAVLFS